MQELDAPFFPRELPRHPVEQLGMRGAAAEFAKVAGRGHDPAAEVPVPIPITITRAVIGLSALAIHWARARRRLRVGQRWKGSRRIGVES